jgi:hypothetical protein
MVICPTVQTLRTCDYTHLKTGLLLQYALLAIAGSISIIYLPIMTTRGAVYFFDVILGR